MAQAVLRILLPWTSQDTSDVSPQTTSDSPTVADPLEPVVVTHSERCAQAQNHFDTVVWPQTLEPKCTRCHTASGIAQNTKFVLQKDDSEIALAQNFAVVQEVAALTQNDTSLLLLKPSAQISHGGGEQVVQGSAEYQDLETMVGLFEGESTCVASTASQVDTARLANAVELLDASATLRKTTLSLTGRLPLESEITAVATGGESALANVVEALMQEDPFYERLKEIYNDVLLTDLFIPYASAINALEDYPDAQWYYTYPGTTAEQDQLGEYTNEHLAREPLELIAHVVREEKPFTEILTADYVMVTPYSARSYGIDSLAFKDGQTPTEALATTWLEGQIPGIPHAGILTSHVFLNRYPTTRTNRHRVRARMVYRIFLGLDIANLAQRPVDPNAVAGVNPTLNNPDCTVCHDILDPVAGAFQNWGVEGRFKPPYLPNRWFPDMQAPGYSVEETIPPESEDTSLQWLAQRIAEDPRFPTAAVQTIYKGLTGNDPLKQPETRDTDYESALLAYTAQQEHFGEVELEFIESHYNLKTVFKQLILGPYFRAENVDSTAGLSDIALADVGTGRLLIPEQYVRKLENTLGIAFEQGDTTFFRLLYGGIDSNSVVERIETPNGIMANLQQRLSNQLGCGAVSLDFTRPVSERLLFPSVAADTVPNSEANITAIRANIQHLHERLLGESLDINDAEIQRTYDLFTSVLTDGQQGLANGTYGLGLGACSAVVDENGNTLGAGERIVRDPQYSIRAWNAVVTLLLLDYRFLYE